MSTHPPQITVSFQTAEGNNETYTISVTSDTWTGSGYSASVDCDHYEQCGEIHGKPVPWVNPCTAFTVALHDIIEHVRIDIEAGNRHPYPDEET